jgi:hypothetical protein
MSQDNININVTENIDQVNIVASEVVEVVDLNLYPTTEDVTINVTEEIIEVNINKVGGSNVTKTSDLINDGADGTSTYVETNELGATAFSNDYNDLDNLPTIPEAVTKTSELTNDGEDGVNPFITLEDIPPIDISTLVPYTGATQDIDLGDNGISAGFLKFDTTPTDIPEVQGAMFWDENDNTVDVILNGYRMKIGEDTFYPVKNQSGSTITKGTNVKFAGTLGSSGRLLILPFLADGTYPSYVYMGVAAEDIANGEDGKVLWFGRLRGLNTNTFNEGDILYASTTSAGGFQTTIPTGNDNLIQVAAVIKKSVNQGVIFIRPQIEPLLFKPENVANKSTSTSLGTSDTLYPTQNAVKNYVDLNASKIQVVSLQNRWTLTNVNVYYRSRGDFSGFNEGTLINVMSGTTNYATLSQSNRSLSSFFYVANGNKKLDKIYFDVSSTASTTNNYTIMVVACQKVSSSNINTTTINGIDLGEYPLSKSSGNVNAFHVITPNDVTIPDGYVVTYFLKRADGTAEMNVTAHFHFKNA